MFKRFKVKNLVDNKLTKVTYTKNISGFPYLDRLTGGKNLKYDLFKIIKTEEFEIQTSEFGIGTFTLTHNLGYQVFAEGSYRLEKGVTNSGTSYPNNYNGLIPQFKRSSYGSQDYVKATITENTNSHFTVALDIPDFEGKVACKLNLLRESIV